MSAVIRGSKGGSKQHTPVESPDSLRSIAFFRILDLVSEGEIGGLVNGQQSIFLDETPLANADGVLNFPKAHIELRTGTQDQEVIPGFDSVENEIAVGVELRSSAAWTHSVTDTELSALRVTLSVPALSKANTSNGDITGYTIAYKIELSTDGGAFAPVYNGSFSGKTTSKFQRSHRIDLPDATTGWQVKVTRLTANADSSSVADITTVDSYTEIIDAKLRYPNSALVGLMGDASQFQNIPQRAYEMFGRIIRVPSNYDVTTRTYTGTWDGTFVPSWTDNPAWVFYDLVTHPRYGLGHLISDSQVDKWALYRIGQYCDELVDDGNGGTEPRFSCNIYLQTQADAYKLLNDLSTVFRGISYWANGAIMASADMPGDPVYTYDDANVIDGKFTYSASSRKTRYTVALVSWNDPNNFYRTKVEYVENTDGIARYGIQETTATAVGCTSQGQAQRFGQWLLLTSLYETDTVTFSVGLDGTLAAPGQIIRVADSARAGARQSGRLSAATDVLLTVDKMPTVDVGDTITVNMPDGVSQTRTVSGVTSDSILVSTAFSEAPAPQSVWVVESAELVAQTFRVLSVTEDKSDTGISFTITALQHNASKFSAVDNGTKIQVPPISALTITNQPGPSAVGLSSREIVDPVATYQALTIAWTSVPGAVSYEGEWRKDSGEWQPIGTQLGLSADVVGIGPGDYLARIRAKGTGGAFSLYTLSDTLTVDPPQTLPTSVGGIKDTADNATPAWILNPNFKDELDKWSNGTSNAGWYYSHLDPYRPNSVFDDCVIHAGPSEALGAGGSATDTLTNMGYLPVTPGEMVTLSAQIAHQGDAISGYGLVRISWRDSADAEISHSDGNGLRDGTSTVIGSAPAGAVGARAQLHVEGNNDRYLFFTAVKGFPQALERILDEPNTTRTATASDNHAVIRSTNAAGLVITIEAESTHPVAMETQLFALATSGLPVKFIAGAGVTFDTADSYECRAVGSVIGMVRVGPDRWQACGDLAYTAPAVTVTGNATNVSAQPQNIPFTSDGHHLVRRSGSIVSELLTAANTQNVPAGGIAATNVQAAINELDVEKASVTGAETFAAATGTADALVATFSPAITAPVDGMQIKVRATAASATTTPTLQVNALTALPITKNGSQPLAAGDIYGAGHELLLRYVVSTPRWELLNPASASGGGGSWGSITGTLSDQTDLQTALNAKADASGVALSGRVATYAALPGGLGSGDAGKAYLVDADRLVYVWSGTAFPASGGGLAVSRTLKSAFYSSNTQETLSKTLSFTPTHTLVPSDFAVPTGFSYTYTPISSLSHLRVKLTIPYTGTNNDVSLRVGLIAGSTVVAGRNNYPARYYPVSYIVADLVPGSTAPITFTIGFATSAASNIYVNGGTDGNKFFNGAAPNTLEIEEYLP